jgi:hypothetical protein
MYDALTFLHEQANPLIFKYSKKLNSFENFIEPIVGFRATPKDFRKLRFSSLVESSLLKNVDSANPKRSLINVLDNARIFTNHKSNPVLMHYVDARIISLYLIKNRLKLIPMLLAPSPALEYVCISSCYSKN